MVGEMSISSKIQCVVDVVGLVCPLASMFKPKSVKLWVIGSWSYPITQCRIKCSMCAFPISILISDTSFFVFDVSVAPLFKYNSMACYFDKLRNKYLFVGNHKMTLCDVRGERKQSNLLHKLASTQPEANNFLLKHVNLFFFWELTLFHGKWTTNVVHNWTRGQVACIPAVTEPRVPRVPVLGHNQVIQIKIQV